MVGLRLGARQHLRDGGKGFAVFWAGPVRLQGCQVLGGAITFVTVKAIQRIALVQIGAPTVAVYLGQNGGGGNGGNE